MAENPNNKEFVRWEEHINRNFSGLLYPDYIEKQALFFNKIFPNNMNKSILEPGGLGLVSMIEAMKENKVTILDYDKETIEQSIEHATNLKVVDRMSFTVGNIFDMPFDDGSFDIVWNEGVLEHFDDMKSAINEMKRVCKVNGKILIPNKYTIHTYFVRPWKRFRNKYPPDIWGRERSYSPKDLRRIMEECGIKVLEVGSFNLARSLFDDRFCGFTGRIPRLQREVISIRNFVDKHFSNILSSFGFITYCLGEKNNEKIQS